MRVTTALHGVIERMKFILGILLGIAVALFIVQNTEVAEVRFLFWSVAMSRALLFFVLLLAGVAIGWLLHAARAHRRQAGRADRRP